MGVYQKGKNWYIDYYFRGRRKRRKIGPSKKLAEQVLKDVQVKLAKGEYLGVHEQKKVTFGEFAQRYLDFCKASKAWSTYKRRDKVSVEHLKTAFEGKYLFEITPRMVDEYKAKRLGDVAPATVNREVACLKHMYTKAVEWNFATANPVRAVKLLKEPPGRLRYLSPEEANRLLEACAGYLKSIIITALNTGMRKGEILALRWADVDLANRKITVKKAKNNEIRVIPINRTLYGELAALAEKPVGAYVFCNADGEPFGDIKTGF